MKDYQRKAPDQLSNDNLISILWNKVPFKLQKEVGEIKDWSLQELLQRLLRAVASGVTGPPYQSSYSKATVAAG